MCTVASFANLSFTALLGFASASFALGTGDKVDNFRLLDHKGGSQELYYFSDMKAVVLMAHGNACSAAVKDEATLQGLREKYRAQGVEVLLIDSNLADSRDTIADAARKANIDIPVLLDDTQLIGESLSLARNGEVLVINPKNWQLAYRGSVGKAAAAVDAVIAGSAVATANTKSEGCPIAMPETKRRGEHAKISYEKTIAPMFIDNCIVCHRQGGIGPWQMSSYDMVKGFAPMIREVVRTERMPPWHADLHYNAFKNDRSLSMDQVKTLVHWIEAGAPRGTGGDPLAALQKTWPEWSLGEPDLIVEIPSFDVPATGVIPYQTPSANNPLDHDVWVRAVDFIPGDRTVLHHIIAVMSDGGSLGGYVPGAGPLVMPDEASILLKKNAKFSFQMHYTVSGKQATDKTRMGIYFRKEAPPFLMRSAVLANPRLKIPANAKAYTESAATTFKQDILVYSLMVHAHFRGKAANFVATYPDGREETLLSVPKYDFNWQTTYQLKTPKVLPAGTKVTHTTTWDNSTQNKANPDHDRIVPWGEQTWDEMLYGVVRYRYVTEPATQAQQISQTTP